VNAPTREDAERLDARAEEYLRLAGDATDDAVKRDRLKQAAAARFASARIIDALAEAVPASPPEWGLPISYAGPRHAPAFAPGPR
jgi:hypothetical protein